MQHCKFVFLVVISLLSSWSSVVAAPPFVTKNTVVAQNSVGAKKLWSVIKLAGAHDAYIAIAGQETTLLTGFDPKTSVRFGRWLAQTGVISGYSRISASTEPVVDPAFGIYSNIVTGALPFHPLLQSRFLALHGVLSGEEITKGSQKKIENAFRAACETSFRMDWREDDTNSQAALRDLVREQLEMLKGDRSCGDVGAAEMATLLDQSMFRSVRVWRRYSIENHDADNAKSNYRDYSLKRLYLYMLNLIGEERFLLRSVHYHTPSLQEMINGAYIEDDPSETLEAIGLSQAEGLVHTIEGPGGSSDEARLGQAISNRLASGNCFVNSIKGFLKNSNVLRQQNNKVKFLFARGRVVRAVLSGVQGVVLKRTRLWERLEMSLILNNFMDGDGKDGHEFIVNVEGFLGSGLNEPPSYEDSIDHRHFKDLSEFVERFKNAYVKHVESSEFRCA